MQRVIQTLQGEGCEEVALEAEVTNVGALRLYERLGFVRDKRLKRWARDGLLCWALRILGGEEWEVSWCAAHDILHKSGRGVADFGEGGQEGMRTCRDRGLDVVSIEAVVFATSCVQPPARAGTT